MNPEQLVVTGNTQNLKRELDKLIAAGWRCILLAGVPGPSHQGQFVAVLERKKK